VQAIADAAKKSQLIRVRPTVGLFFMDWAVPIEFKIGYFLPVWGKSTTKNDTINAQIRVYYKI